jgi:Flp pilus assembly protein TadG
MRLIERLSARRDHDESGVVAIIVAVAMVGLLLAGALVLDFGLVRVERQGNKLAADSAVTAGLRAGDTGGGQMNTAAAVCGALDFLRANNPSLSGLPANGCPPPANTVCSPTDPTTWTTYTATTSSGRTTYEVTIQSPYTFEGSGFPEDDLPSLTSDVGMDEWEGCDQVAVMVRQSTERSLGVLAGDDDLTTRIRSVGRVNLGDGKQAPALLLLDRKNCGVLTVGSSGGGSTSEIKVYGSADQPGTIHADTDASACGSSVFVGNKTDGLIAYSSLDESKPGSLTSVAGFMAKPMSAVRDDPNKVYGFSAKDSTSPGTKLEPTGRSIVTREPVDNRYLEGVRDAVAEANGTAFNQTSFTSPTWKTLTACGTRNASTVEALNLTAADRLYVNCSGYNSNAPLRAGTIYFNGGGISNANMPNATRVYIKSADADAIRLTNGNTFAVRGGDAGTSTCTDDAGLGQTAKLVISSGKITATGGVLRLCNTAVVLMGGAPDACLPAPGFVQEPTSTPCSGGTGTGQVSIAGGASQDWTAPNEHAAAIPEAAQTAAWRGNLEDLALWSESYGGNSNPSYSMAGGSGMHMVGVFMTPNATPFTVTGGGSQDLNNAQYIATSFVVKGGASLKMRVDPNTVVSLPAFDRWTLVR